MKKFLTYVAAAAAIVLIIMVAGLGKHLGKSAFEKYQQEKKTG